jgi:hypothetical protein
METTLQTIHAGKYDPMTLIEGEKEHPLSPTTIAEIPMTAMCFIL